LNEKPHKPHFHVTAGIIWQDEKILITRRPEGSHLSGCWEFPGGKQEEGEDLIGCLAREIREELDLEIQVQKALFTVHHKYDAKAVTIHFFDCTIIKGNPKPMEGQEVRWVKSKDLNGYVFPPPDQKVIEYLVSTRK
jgi:mutator protein MutT